MEKEVGLMVIVAGRLVEDAERGYFQDVERRFWVSFDRQRETWSSRITRRHNEATQTSATTGSRRGAVLTLVHSNTTGFARESETHPIPDKAYLSQPEVLLLGHLLASNPELKPELAFYFYDPRAGRVLQRRDHWTATTGDNGEAWQLESRIGPDA
ncbi:MAG: hypothetical protein GY953_45320, partial [bacterium]|nr:hypothetical protein [bacterium]